MFIFRPARKFDCVPGTPLRSSILRFAPADQILFGSHHVYCLKPELIRRSESEFLGQEESRVALVLI